VVEGPAGSLVQPVDILIDDDRSQPGFFQRGNAR
jgi:hypothetical protein